LHIICEGRGETKEKRRKHSIVHIDFKLKLFQYKQRKFKKYTESQKTLLKHNLKNDLDDDDV
jgi:hypothetical protein